MQRRLPLLKPERYEFVLIVEHIDQGPVGRRRGQELLSTIGPRSENDEECRKNNPLKVSHILVPAVWPLGKHTKLLTCGQAAAHSKLCDSYSALDCSPGLWMYDTSE